MSDVLCPQCNAVNRSTARYCSECGAPLPGGQSQAASPVVTNQPGTAQQPPASLPSEPQATGQSPGPESTTAKPSPAEEPVTASKTTLLGRYQIERELGRGGFGAVYKAWDVNLSRACAVKENMDTSTEAQRQFAREATVLANLSHPNLPRVTDHFSIPGQGQYLVMDFVEGEDLATVINREKQVSVESAVDWISQAADALTYLHNRQPPVVHRDIKPANIRITPEGKVMLVDFGLVKVYDPQLKTTLGARAVTPGYAPPEQYGMGRTDARSDIYALGATLYKLLTGQEPMESVQRIAGGKMTPASDLNKKVPLVISQAIEKAMALDPADRFNNAAAFKAAIQEGLSSSTNRAGQSEAVLVSPGGAHPVAAPSVSSPAGVEVGASATGHAGAAGNAAPPAGRSRTPGSAAAVPAARPGSHPPTQAPAKGRPVWLWIGAAGAIMVLLLCVASGGGLLAMLRSGNKTPTPAITATVEALNPRGETSPTATTQVQVSPQGETPAAVQPSATPQTPPTVEPSPTADPHFLSPNPQQFVYVDLGYPQTLDPSFDYETSGLSVLQNIYDTLIFYNREKADQFVPQLALEVPSVQNGLISADGLSYTFKIRPDVKFQDGSPLTVEDVAYTFQRGILQGGTQTPQWLLTEPLFGVGIYDVAALIDPALQDNPDGLKKADPAKLGAVCQQVKDAIVADPGAGTVTFHLKQPWGPFLPTLANAWGGIRSKAWTVANGGWDGDCGTWPNFYGRTADELNKLGIGKNAMGTGPYKLGSWDQKQIVLQANDNYWRKEPAWPGGPAGAPRIKTVVIAFDTPFDSAVEKMKKGEVDSVATDTPVDWPSLDAISGLECVTNDLNCTPTSTPDGTLERIQGVTLASRPNDITFNFQINTQGGNSFIGSGRLDGAGVPPDFFTNVHVRRAFAYCFNYDRYLKEVLQGEGVRSINVMLPNMIGYDPNSPYYTYDTGRCTDELRQAQFDGKTVWDTGFRLVLPYSSGTASRKVIAQIFKDELGALNNKFRIEAREISVDDYNNYESQHKLPYTTVSWVEDIHDPHNWVYPYTLGNLGHWQNMPQDLLNQFQDVISRAVEQLDPQARSQIYREFNQQYYDAAPAILLFQMVGRHYQQRWVNGWFGNPVLPGPYYYILSKN